jgi:hypothetical protein
MNLFDYTEAQRRKNCGMNLAANAKQELLKQAQESARQMAERFGEATSDDVARDMEALGLNYSELKNAAGSVFNGFVWTGKVISSGRASTHGRIIKVWKLKK